MSRRIFITRRPEYRVVALPRDRYRDRDSRRGYPSEEAAHERCAAMNDRTQRKLGLQAYRVIVIDVAQP